MRRFEQTARLLHRSHDAVRGTGRDVLQIAMPLYYGVSSSRLFLVCHSKQSSKTTSKQRPNSSFPTTRSPSYHSICQRPPLCFARVAVARPAPSPRAHAQNARRRPLTLRPQSNGAPSPRDHPSFSFDRASRRGTDSLAAPNEEHTRNAKERSSSPSRTRSTPKKPKNTTPRYRRLQDLHKVAGQHD